MDSGLQHLPQCERKPTIGYFDQKGKLHVTKIKVAAGTEETSVAADVNTASEPQVDTTLTPPPPPLPDHVVDPIPKPVVVEAEEVITETGTDRMPDLSDLGTDADSGSVGDQGQIEFGEPETGGVGPPVPPPPLHNQYPVPPAVEVETPDESEAEPIPASGFGAFIDGIRLGPAWVRVVSATTGVLALGAVGFFLFANQSEDTPVALPSDQVTQAVTDPEPTSGTEDQAVTDSEPTSGTGSGEGQPISSAHFADPAVTTGGREPGETF